MSDKSESPSVVKERISLANRVLGNWYVSLGLGSVLMTFGHVSEKIPETDQFYIRGRPLTGDYLIGTRTSDIITVDLSSRKVEGSPDVSMPGETKLHSFIYKIRNDAKAVCHAHPHFSVLAADLGLKLKPMCNEGIDLFPVKTYMKNALISNDLRGAEFVRALGKANSCLLRGHGAVTIGDSCEVAVIRMIQLEEQARLNVLGFMAKGSRYAGIPKRQATEYLSSAREGLRHSGLSEDQIRKHLSGLNLWAYLAKQVS